MLVCCRLITALRLRLSISRRHAIALHTVLRHMAYDASRVACRLLDVCIAGI